MRPARGHRAFTAQSHFQNHRRSRLNICTNLLFTLCFLTLAGTLTTYNYYHNYCRCVSNRVFTKNFTIIQFNCSGVAVFHHPDSLQWAITSFSKFPWNPLGDNNTRRRYMPCPTPACRYPVRKATARQKCCNRHCRRHHYICSSQIVHSNEWISLWRSSARLV